jgi:hypothetical protein
MPVVEVQRKVVMEQMGLGEVVVVGGAIHPELLILALVGVLRLTLIAAREGPAFVFLPFHSIYFHSFTHTISLFFSYDFYTVRLVVLYCFLP